MNSVAQVIPSSTLRHVPLSDIKRDTARYRQEFSGIESLVTSIKEKGVLQPVTLSPDMRILAGERRIRASELAGLQEIPALIRQIDGEIDAREIELMENLERKDFTWQEKLAGLTDLDRLYKEKNTDWSGRKTAALVGGSTANIARQLEVAKFMRSFPELQAERTFDDAYKLLDKFKKKVTTDVLSERQQTAIKAAEDALPDAAIPTGMSKATASRLRTADANYRVQDTLLGLAELPSEGRIHLIECDPPYGIDLTAVKASKDNSSSNVHSYQDIPAEQYAAFLNTLALDLFRVAGRDCWLIFWFGPTWHHEVKMALQTAGWKVDDIPAIWIKSQGQTLQPTIYLARGYEPFFLCRKGEPFMNKPGRLNVFDFQPLAGVKKYHPTERPLALMEELLATLTIPTQIVLVPFLGSGVTLRACYRKDLLGFGFDSNELYKANFMLAVEDDSRSA